MADTILFKCLADLLSSTPAGSCGGGAALARFRFTHTVKGLVVGLLPFSMGGGLQCPALAHGNPQPAGVLSYVLRKGFHYEARY